MANTTSEKSATSAKSATARTPTIPPDDQNRTLTLADLHDPQQLHLSVAGDTYTILLTGANTAGRFCLIDMFVPPGGGPPSHRHDFEESFTVLEGEIEATFRGNQSVIRAGQTINIPANAPHQFRNASQRAARLLCICSPAMQEDFFREVGDPVSSRTAPPPHLDEAAKAARMAKAQSLAAKYRTEFLKP